ncbi:GIY-YIG nuclease family protein [Synechococcus sp. PCC 7335]|uniref:GIY-YIG nuclease family protein n=1 Tax=Synechococcus sp. (strain ATCC 29403 / PCC 7335) TaxID=91464 RepID=UPI000680C5C4|nr:GIY-YIG nuclease family protein [Synechococcus sp. PCC 7335]
MTNLLNLPAISAIYRIWHRDEVVYVGQTKNLRQRWRHHHILPKLIACYGTDWRLDWIAIEEANLIRAEAFSYRCFRPLLNQRNPSEQLGL